MTEKNMQEVVVGYITPKGEKILIDEVDRMFAFISGRHEDPGVIIEFLLGAAQECLEYGKHEAASRYFEKALALIDSPEERASFLLYTGLMQEQVHDYAAAIETYRGAFALPQESDDTWYFLNNNLGFCLNQMGRFAEAEGYCSAAIGIDPRRHNAHKNLGITLHGMGRPVEAARSFFRAARLCPEDGRAQEHLEQLLAAHPEILEELAEGETSVH